MTQITLPAHFDGERIQLDMPYQLSTDSKLSVTVYAANGDEDEDQDWLRLRMSSLAATYGSDEPEYDLAMIKEVNPHYEAG